MADRFAVPFQAFITNGAVITSDVTGRVATAGDTVLTLSTTGGAGTFTITLGSGCTGTLTSGTATITDSPKALAAGANTCTSNGAGNCTLNLTLGTDANWNTVNTWSATSGGVSGAAVPGATDHIYFNANSITAAGQTVTVDATATCLAMDWIGATNAPAFAVASNILLSIYGNATFIAAMSTSAGNTSSKFDFRSQTGTQTITTNGLTIAPMLSLYTGVNGTARTVVLADNYASTGQIEVVDGAINTNGKTVSCSAFTDLGAARSKTLTFGASVITCASFNMSGTAPTITANTAIINDSGNFTGGSLNYNGLTLNLTGATSTITGSNTFNTLGLTRVGVQTITFTDGTTQTVTYITRDTGTALKTLQGSGAAGWALTMAGDYVYLCNASVSRLTVTPSYRLILCSGGTDGGNNTGLEIARGGYARATAKVGGTIVEHNSSYTITGVTVANDGGTIVDIK